MASPVATLPGLVQLVFGSPSSSSLRCSVVALQWEAACVLLCHPGQAASDPSQLGASSLPRLALPSLLAPVGSALPYPPGVARGTAGCIISCYFLLQLLCTQGTGYSSLVSNFPCVPWLKYSPFPADPPQCNHTSEAVFSVPEISDHRFFLARKYCCSVVISGVGLESEDMTSHSFFLRENVKNFQENSLFNELAEILYLPCVPLKLLEIPCVGYI